MHLRDVVGRRYDIYARRFDAIRLAQFATNFRGKSAPHSCAVADVREARMPLLARRLETAAAPSRHIDIRRRRPEHGR